jgi:hypothetical protein
MRSEHWLLVGVGVGVVPLPPLAIGVPPPEVLADPLLPLPPQALSPSSASALNTDPKVRNIIIAPYFALHIFEKMNDNRIVYRALTDKINP